MTLVCKYVALHVPDLRAAEAFYRDAFGMELLFRERQAEDGTWSTLRPELSWDDAVALSIDVDMVALRRDAFVLALFHGTPTPGTVYEVCLGLTPAELEDVRARAVESATVNESQPAFLRLEDPFGFRWALQQADASFRSSGEIAGRWLPAV